MVVGGTRCQNASEGNRPSHRDVDDHDVRRQHGGARPEVFRRARGIYARGYARADRKGQGGAMRLMRICLAWSCVSLLPVLAMAQTASSGQTETSVRRLYPVGPSSFTSLGFGYG